MESSSSKHLITFLLTALIFISSYTYSTSAARDIRPSKTNTEFIRTSCTVATYPKLCFSSLSSHASSIQSSPHLIASTALGVTLSSAKTTSTMMLNLSLSHGLKPKVVDAVKDCMEELSDAVDELRMSMEEMGKLVKGGPMLNNIQTWVSAALTDETTCTDGFEGNEMNGSLKNTVRRQIVNVAKLTSNALALINRFALIHG